MTPGYYSSLEPFEELFKTGTAILAYHKIGRRPFGARLKGLYLGRRLFTRQLRELHAAGFSGMSLGGFLQPSSPGKKVVITFDDGYQNVFLNALEALAETNFKAIQFIVPGLLGQRNTWDLASGEVPEPLMDHSQVQEWLKAGHEIGSHSLTHPFLTRLPLKTAQEEITASKKMLEDLFGVPIQHFCYPYGDRSPAVCELVANAGYRTACTTDFGVNLSETPKFELKRLTARYRSRNWKNLKSFIFRKP
ncbi:MAG: Polysaccharide deacetylase [Verrucomicrobiales bacterium]|nr:Polysaccharide deacetylase [Verrucomicrobiales bacterium]